MPLKKADRSSTRKFEDGGDWIELRTVLTKGESDRIRDLTVSARIDPRMIAGDPGASEVLEVANRVANANRALFEILCLDWSLGDVSGQAYADLDEESGEWVDECIGKVLEERRKRAEGKDQSSKKRSARRASSSSERAST